jgi:hypothetical protein
MSTLATILLRSSARRVVGSSLRASSRTVVSSSPFHTSKNDNKDVGGNPTDFAPSEWTLRHDGGDVVCVREVTSSGTMVGPYSC